MAAVVEVVVKVAEVVMVVIYSKITVPATNSKFACLCTSDKALAAMVVREAVEPRAGMVAMAVLPYQAPVW